MAGGNQYGLSSAARMLELNWDDELSRLAEFNVKYCNISYDFCHKTDKYPYSGQNIFSAQSYNNFLDTNTVIQDAIKAWYSQSQYATQNSLDYFTGFSQKFVLINIFLELKQMPIPFQSGNWTLCSTDSRTDRKRRMRSSTIQDSKLIHDFDDLQLRLNQLAAK